LPVIPTFRQKAKVFLPFPRLKNFSEPYFKKTSALKGRHYSRIKIEKINRNPEGAALLAVL
jgi:hypothetical protein